MMTPELVGAPGRLWELLLLLVPTHKTVPTKSRRRLLDARVRHTGPAGGAQPPLHCERRALVGIQNADTTVAAHQLLPLLTVESELLGEKPAGEGLRVGAGRGCRGEGRVRRPSPAPIQPQGSAAHCPQHPPSALFLLYTSAEGGLPRGPTPLAPPHTRARWQRCAARCVVPGPGGPGFKRAGRGLGFLAAPAPAVPPPAVAALAAAAAAAAAAPPEHRAASLSMSKDAVRRRREDEAPAACRHPPLLEALPLQAARRHPPWPAARAPWVRPGLVRQRGYRASGAGQVKGLPSSRCGAAGWPSLLGLAPRWHCTQPPSQGPLCGGWGWGGGAGGCEEDCEGCWGGREDDGRGGGGRRGGRVETQRSPGASRTLPAPGLQGTVSGAFSSCGQDLLCAPLGQICRHPSRPPDVPVVYPVVDQWLARGWAKTSLVPWERRPGRWGKCVLGT